MHPIEVDVIRLQAPQRLLARRRQIDLRLAPPPLGSPEYMLPKNFVAITTRSRRAGVPPDVIANDFFRVALCVYIGGVDEVAALIEIPVEHLFRFSLAGPEAPVLAERHRAQAERAHA